MLYIFDSSHIKKNKKQEKNAFNFGSDMHIVV